MDLLSGLSIGRETMVSHGEGLATIADNLANVNTTGFKQQRSDFSDLLAASIGNLYGAPLTSGNGVQVQDIQTIFTQGPLEATGRGLDFAMEGDGFFTIDNSGSQLYTRAGNFGINADGDLVNAEGFPVLGFTAASPTTAVKLNVNGLSSQATASTKAAFTGNLSATSPITTVATNPASFTALNALSSFHTPVTVLDSLGQSHDIGLHFFHTANLGWTAEAYVDGADVGGTAGTPTSLGSVPITFDSSGSQGATATTALTVSPAWANGATAGAISIDLSKMTGTASTSAIASASVDGNKQGSPSGYALDSSGNFVITLDNGGKIAVGQLAIAKFVNNNGLTRAGDSNFIATDKAGEAKLAAAGTDGRGTVASGSLENSTVDPASEFVNVVRYQRGYQSGSQVVQTMSQLLETTINLL